ncbi:META domain-containing protein [Parabacteroides sp. Marseille-P3160]|uniref:META domain-containing protein n=1 Tax=Parabacteroides sp. Marseille-P3160 TaxID=1917887 RepID=UPI001356EB0A|nr:META domain-containing protein [Parabacteroides sp. Marseille-P3160]
MKTNKLLLITLSFLSLFEIGGCDDSDKFSEPELLKTWKLVGFGTTENNEIQTVKPEDCEECYTLTFHEDGTFSGQTSTNQVTGKYKISYQDKELKILNLGGTEINELYDGKLYVESLLKVESYSITERGLELYYNSKKQFLLFKPIIS